MMEHDGVQSFLVQTNEKTKHIGALDIVGLIGVSLFFCFVVYLCVV